MTEDRQTLPQSADYANVNLPLILSGLINPFRYLNS